MQMQRVAATLGPKDAFSPNMAANVWTDCVSQERIWLDSGSRWYVFGLFVGSRAVALMGIRAHF